MQVRHRLHGKWIYGSRIRVVNLAKHDSRNQFWWKKRGVLNSGASVSKVNVDDGRQMPEVRVENGPPTELCVTSRVEEMRLEEISGVHVMRMSGPRVLLIFDSVEVQQQVTQSGVLDSISSLSKSMSAGEEERCDQVDARGTYNVVGGYDDGVKVQVDDGVANGVAVRQEESLVRSLEASLGRVCWRGNGLWNGHEGVSDALVPTVHEEQLVDVAVNCIGPVVEGSTTEELVANGYKRKVRLLTNVISSLHSPEEKRKADKALQWWGRGCPRYRTDSRE
ncbi:hypothetical protein V6N12_062138 [Hibiscus sabdariffa]|uniref:Uncharacterized protein n=1 Tax=Hibiscus sabdariffa TaxID=183260 RepID=A0ABR2F806_9ROSI